MILVVAKSRKCSDRGETCWMGGYKSGETVGAVALPWRCHCRPEATATLAGCMSHSTANIASNQTKEERGGGTRRRGKQQSFRRKRPAGRPRMRATFELVLFKPCHNDNHCDNHVELSRNLPRDKLAHSWRPTTADSAQLYYAGRPNRSLHGHVRGRG